MESQAVPRWATPRTPSRKTLGYQVAAISRNMLGRELMPWQKMVADVALELDPETGLPVYRTVVLTVPRQSGKTTLLLSLMLQRCLSPKWGADGKMGGKPGRQKLIYTAQTNQDAKSKFRKDFLPEFEASKVLKDKYSVYLGSGSESVSWPNGSSISIGASTKKSGHGQTLDLAIVDEAFALVDDRLDQAFVPAMSTRQAAQLWIVSTAGDPTSLYLKAKVEKGREAVEAGRTEDIAYFEWSLEDGADPNDATLWPSCMPAYGITVTEKIVRAAFANMALSQFRRSYLNQWVEQSTDRVIEAEDWAKCEDFESAIAAKPVALGLEMSADRQKVALSLAGLRADGLPHVQTVRWAPGSEWVIKEIQTIEALLGSRLSIIVDRGSPAASLVPDLINAKVEVRLIGTSGLAAASGSTYDSIKSNLIRVPYDEPLNTAVVAARQRHTADAWVWARRAGDVAPLIAATLALHGVRTTDGTDYDPLTSLY